MLLGCINFLSIDVKNEITSSSTLMDIEDHVDKMNLAISKLNTLQAKLDIPPKNEKGSQKVMNELWTNTGKDFKGFFPFLLFLQTCFFALY